MSIAFNAIPLDLRTPGQYIEFDATRAVRGLPANPHKVIILGQKLAAGAAAASVLVQIRTADEALTAFGRGSMLHRMVKAFRANDALSDLWVFPQSDVGGGVQAAGTVVITGPATAAGVIPLMIAGQRVPVAVTAAQTATQIGDAMAAAVNAAVDLPVTAANVTGTVTFTARHKGVAGNFIDIRAGYYQGEALPAGVALAFTAMANGATNPDATALFTAIGDLPFTALIHPYTDATNLAAIETAIASRWGPMRALDGFAYTAHVGIYSALTTLGTGRNSAFGSILGIKASPTPPWELAAAYGAQVGFAASIDPARPFQTLPLVGVLAPAIADRFLQAERDGLLRSGISTSLADPAGNVSIERAVTTYQTNAAGVADAAFLDVNTPLTLAALRYSLRARIALKYPRHKLVSDGTPIPPGQPMVSPRSLRSEVIAWFLDAQAAGLVEGLEQFKADLVIERDATDPNRVNALIPPDVVNQLRVFAAQVQFLL